MHLPLGRHNHNHLRHIVQVLKFIHRSVTKVILTSLKKITKIVKSTKVLKFMVEAIKINNLS